MSHLLTDRLAELADSEPSADEQLHLASCVVCARERAAHQAVRASALAERDRIAPPLTAWAPIAERLRAEGIIAARPVRHVARGWMEAAAAVLLMVGGVAVGRFSANASGPGPLPSSNSTPLAISVATPNTPARFASRADAMSAMAKAQDTYQRGAAYLAGEDSSTLDADTYRTRLAALDEMSATARAALYQAPQDPVINQYYLATLGAREATMRQISAQMPVGTVTRF